MRWALPFCKNKNLLPTAEASLWRFDRLQACEQRISILNYYLHFPVMCSARTKLFERVPTPSTITYLHPYLQPYDTEEHR